MPLFQYQHPRTYVKEVLADTPLSLWMLNDFSASTVVRDLMVLHNGTITGDGVSKNTSGPGRGLDMAFTLAGTDDGVQVGDFAEYEFAGDFTAECWIFPTNAADSTVIAKRNGATGEWSLVWLSTGAILAFLTNTASGTFLQATGGSAPLNKWSHIAMTVSGTTVTAYVNGVSVATSSSTTGTRRTSSTDSMAIGFSGNGTTDEVTGRLAGAAVYTSALTGARLLEHVKAAMV